MEMLIRFWVPKILKLTMPIMQALLQMDIITLGALWDMQLWLKMEIVMT